MRLIELRSDHKSFQTIRFNPEGMTLIVGDGSRDKKEGSSNGVGKTLALGLVHHCLGANVDGRLRDVVPDWTFSLSLSHNGSEHLIERSGDGRRITLDGKPLAIKGLRSWLDKCGAFRLDPGLPGLTFRSLFTRFGRHYREDCNDPLRTKKEPEFDADFRSLYLLGLDCRLALSKRDNKVELENIQRTTKVWKQDGVLRDTLLASGQPKVRLEWLEREIPRLRSDLNQFQVAENYRAVESNIDDLTKQMRKAEQEVAIIRFQLEGIEKSLANQPDISRNQLLELYDGLKATFTPEVIQHFEAVEKFHNSLAINRGKRLTQDKHRLQSEMKSLEGAISNLARQRDAKAGMLQGKRALDEYASMSQKMASLEEERKRLVEYLGLNARLQDDIQKLKATQLEEDSKTKQYLAGDPAAELDQYFRQMAEKLYPHSPAGISLELNTGTGKIRYDLAVHMEGKASDGINAASIVCFDWLLLMRGANHAMDFLWHDNRLFAHIDPRPRAAWFSHLLHGLPGTGKQYIATINTENYDAMKEHLTSEDQETLGNAVVLRLRGDKPENKLLGVQFSGR
jgi:uncharacterized protein YydD (DUF2326 family)